MRQQTGCCHLKTVQSLPPDDSTYRRLEGPTVGYSGGSPSGKPESRALGSSP